ncbi:MAG: hypothetical protein IKL52_04980 [Candidatus Gastranaerophilales bacterium]|nr:hypothetical protein [Candidatus Gastranaerophilales bacterium]
MIDTIRLTFYKGEFEIKNYDVFTPSAEVFYQLKTCKKLIKCTCNTSKKELAQGLYYPKLTLRNVIQNGVIRLCLFVEFSIPKLMYGNNFEEVTNDDFEKIVIRLKEKLAEKGVVINEAIINTSKATMVHYSKNIVIENCRSQFIISKINKVDVPRKIDTTKCDFKNDGSAIKFHTNSYELTFYDKVADLRQSMISDKRAIENENSIQQDLLADRLKNKEILRMEVRLNTTKKIKDTLKKVGFIFNELRFEDVFNIEISRKVLLYFWENYINKSIASICLCEEDISTIQEKLINAGVKIQDIYKILGIIASINESCITNAKNQIKTYNFKKLNKYFDLVYQDDNYLLNQFKNIENAILKMEAIKL